MSSVLVKKLKTITGLMKNPCALGILKNRIPKNIRELIVASKKNKAFAYKVRAGHKFVCFPEQKASIRLYIKGGLPDEAESRIARNWLLEGDNCLDLGANIGCYSVFYAYCIADSGKVIAAEPSEETAKCLEKTAKLLSLKQIRLERACITDRNGFCDFMVSPDGENSVSQSLIAPKGRERMFRKEKTKTATIDNLVEKHAASGNISLVKIDIEGAEPLALRKASLLFNKEALPLFVVEIYKTGLARFNFSPEDVLKYFSSELFEIYLINRSYPDTGSAFKYGVLYPLSDPLPHDWPWHSNIIAVPKAGKYAKRKNRIKQNLI